MSLPDRFSAIGMLRWASHLSPQLFTVFTETHSIPFQHIVESFRTSTMCEQKVSSEVWASEDSCSQFIPNDTFSTNQCNLQ